MSLNGIYRKFRISRTDGRDAPGEKHHGCRYFVLDLDHDPHVWPALRSYAVACSDTHPHLSRDIRQVEIVRRGGELEAALKIFDEKLGRS